MKARTEKILLWLLLALGLLLLWLALGTRLLESDPLAEVGGEAPAGGRAAPAGSWEARTSGKAPGAEELLAKLADLERQPGKTTDVIYRRGPDGELTLYTRLQCVQLSEQEWYELHHPQARSKEEAQ